MKASAPKDMTSSSIEPPEPLHQAILWIGLSVGTYLTTEQSRISLRARAICLQDRAVLVVQILPKPLPKPQFLMSSIGEVSSFSERGFLNRLYKISFIPPTQISNGV